MMWAMSEEAEIVAKTGAEIVTTLAEASGSLGPPRAFWHAITSRIDAHFYPQTVKLAISTADKIRASGLPPKAYAEIRVPLVRAILEAGSEENDETMQERWANLLANALTGSDGVRTAFASILSEMEPGDVALLDLIYESFQAPGRSLRIGPSADFTAIQNLTRLGLITMSYETKLNAGEVFMTGFGRLFVLACKEPVPVPSTG
jgi:abortive infection alpha-like protein